MKVIRYHFNTINSTNTWAKQHVEELDLQHLNLITADQQTIGRGRFKRVWVSPLGLNIYATFCFFVEANYSDVGHIPQLLALSTCYCLESLKFKPSLKWPNDILLEGKKVAGILCETTMNQDRKCVICGIGLNINMPLEELQKIDRPATSLLVESSQEFNVEQILMMVQTQFAADLEIFFKQGFKHFYMDYVKRSYYRRGQQVRFHDNLNIIEGTFYGLNEDGSLTLKLKDGCSQIYYAGEFL